MAGRLELGDLGGPFQPNPFRDPMSLSMCSVTAPCSGTCTQARRFVCSLSLVYAERGSHRFCDRRFYMEE